MLVGAQYRYCVSGMHGQGELEALAFPVLDVLVALMTLATARDCTGDPPIGVERDMNARIVHTTFR